MKLNNNTILITGGSKGIGLELAKRFLDLENNVIICARGEQDLIKIKEKYPKINVIKCDVSNKDERNSMINIIKKNYKTLNVLINNAGIQRDVNFNEDDEINLDEIAINLEAPIHLIKDLLPIIKNNKNSAILNVSSGLAFTPLANVPIYCATKAAMHSLTMSLRYQLKNEVEVIEIIPPAVDTNLNEEGRKKRFDKTGFTFDLKVDKYVDEVMEGLSEKKLEIGFGGNIERVNESTKNDLDKLFTIMNK